MRQTRTILLGGVILALMLPLTPACKKCVTCSVADAHGNMLMDSVRTCGTRDEIKEAQDNARVRAANVGGISTCMEEN